MYPAGRQLFSKTADIWFRSILFAYIITGHHKQFSIATHGVSSSPRAGIYVSQPHAVLWLNHILVGSSMCESVFVVFAAIILGGGAGTRLYPLTKQRAKPAVPIGGAYRLIDVPMSNCINSGISKIYILTQFNSTSLNRHLARTYNMGSGVRFGGEGFVEVLAATQVRSDVESIVLLCHYTSRHRAAVKEARTPWLVAST